GAARALFVPLALAVGFSMVTSYLLSSMFVPVVSVWLLRNHHKGTKDTGQKHEEQGEHPDPGPVHSSAMPPLPFLCVLCAFVGNLSYVRLLEGVVRHRRRLVGAYLAVCVAVLLLAGSRVGTQIFPNVDTGQFLLRIRAATGTRIERTEEIARK